MTFCAVVKTVKSTLKMDVNSVKGDMQTVHVMTQGVINASKTKIVTIAKKTHNVPPVLYPILNWIVYPASENTVAVITVPKIMVAHAIVISVWISVGMILNHAKVPIVRILRDV